MGEYRRQPAGVAGDEVQLLQLFRDAGFAEVRRMGFHESHIPGIERVERSDFLVVEGVKPAESKSRPRFETGIGENELASWPGELSHNLGHAPDV
jgi:hypothetical protein